jgi:N-acetylmuramoyl-L-alanine amidase
LNCKDKRFVVLLGIVVAIAVGIAASALLGQTQSAAPAAPQNQPASGMNHNLVVLDPAHGGPDNGAKLGDQLLEKDVTLALAARLRATLTAAGFTVVSTRDADSFTPLTNDQRAETANRTRAVACLVIHATGTGSGVHVYASALEAKDPPAAGDDFEATQWDSAQAESVEQSLRLQSDLNAAMGTANLPAVMGRAAVKPLDNLTCPAVAVEVAPLRVEGGDTTPVNDGPYQQRVADAVAKALQVWRGHADPPPTAAEVDQTRAATKATAAADAAGQAAAKAAANPHAGGTQ